MLHTCATVRALRQSCEECAGVQQAKVPTMIHLQKHRPRPRVRRYLFMLINECPYDESTDYVTPGSNRIQYETPSPCQNLEFSFPQYQDKEQE